MGRDEAVDNPGSPRLYSAVANAFYNLASDFYEYGWGDSFHFGFRKRGEPHIQAIKNSQNFVAQKLQVR